MNLSDTFSHNLCTTVTKVLKLLADIHRHPLTVNSHTKCGSKRYTVRELLVTKASLSISTIETMTLKIWPLSNNYEENTRVDYLVGPLCIQLV